MTHLLDTNAWIGYIRGKNAWLVARVTAHSSANLALSTIALGELLYGVYHGDPAHMANSLLSVDRLRRTFPILGFDETCADEYGRLQAYLSGVGRRIGSNDTLIAGAALAHDLILVTHNTKDFSRVPRLKIEDWEVP